MTLASRWRRWRAGRLALPAIGMPNLEMPRIEMPRLGFAAFRRRILFRLAFVLLIVVTLALALAVLKEEKQRSVRLYGEGAKRTLAEVAGRLRHPSGQLALLNPEAPGLNAPAAVSPPEGLVRPLVLPYAGLDFSDQAKAQQAVETADCQMQYPDGSTLCVAIGNSARAGGFVYLVGSFATTRLVAREPRELELTRVHRARVTLKVDAETARWIAPFELTEDNAAPGLRGRLTGFVETPSNAGAITTQALERQTRPVREFRAWIWQDAECQQQDRADEACPRRSFFSIRVPVEAYRELIFREQRPAWPPALLGRTGVRLEMFAPGAEQAVFDSATPGALPPFSWADLGASLAPGERLRVRRLDGDPAQRRELLSLRGAEDAQLQAAGWISRLVALLPLGPVEVSPTLSQIIATPVGRFELTLSGDVRAIERNLAATATRLSWFVAAMLGAIALAWLLIEIGLIRRIAVLTRRAAALSHNVNINTALAGGLEVEDLRGKDELGILAAGLADLLQRVQTDLRREQIRAEQERDTWHAVGHEIMSPLQSLMALHGQESDPAHRYVKRMQQAIKVLYGQASPSEALQATQLELASLDLVAFLRHVADNAHYAGIGQVSFESTLGQCLVRADEYSLEDVVTHVLSNAQRHRVAGSAIRIRLEEAGREALISISNQGPQIPAALIDAIFEYGVSGAAANEPQAGEHRGQGLFVARTYMAKMQGSIAALNTADGVQIVLRLPLV